MTEIHGRDNYKQWVFDYSDLAKATGLDINTVQQHRTRKKFDPERIETVVIYLVKHARPDLRLRLLEASLLRDSAETAPRIRSRYRPLWAMFRKA